MLIDTRVVQEEQNTTGFEPNVQNPIMVPNPTAGQKFIYALMIIFSCLLVFGFILWPILLFVTWPNKFNKMQMEINNSASVIDVNLQKRKDTLVKLFDETKAHLKFEKETMIKVTELRSMKNASTLEDFNGASKMNGLMESISRDINVSFEAYPNLKSSQIVAELMSSSQYIETEIAASRRLYNQNVTAFNSEIFAFPKMMKAKSMKLHTLPLFSASTEAKKDVDMSGLANI
ncbi:LemA family protein [Malacoplasma iowae]|uniref:LemA family protein n=1 Tax=Malacoplasma iowae TaxID=2116 RepID=UPI003872BD52|nr:LemA family protein [Malacoplasma iowae]